MLKKTKIFNTVAFAGYKSCKFSSSNDFNNFKKMNKIKSKLSILPTIAFIIFTNFVFIIVVLIILRWNFSLTIRDFNHCPATKVIFSIQKLKTVMIKNIKERTGHFLIFFKVESQRKHLI